MAEVVTMTERNENGHASENVTGRAGRVAIHGEEAVAAAEARADSIGKYGGDSRPATSAERAWLHRARKRGLLGRAEPASPEVPDYLGGGSWDAYRKLHKRRHRREYLRKLVDQAQAGDATAEATLREQIEVDNFNKLYCKYQSFIREWYRAPDRRRQVMLTNTSIADALPALLEEIRALTHPQAS
jgi:hypothetical protein